MKTKIMMIALLLGVLVIIGCATISFEEKMATAEIPYIKDPMQFATNRILINESEKINNKKFWLINILMISDNEVALFYGHGEKIKNYDEMVLSLRMPIEYLYESIEVYLWDMENDSFDLITDAAFKEHILDKNKENYDNYRRLPVNTSYNIVYRFNIFSSDKKISIPLFLVTILGMVKEIAIFKEPTDELVTTNYIKLYSDEFDGYGQVVFTPGSMSLSLDGRYFFAGGVVLDIEDNSSIRLSHYIDHSGLGLYMDISPNWSKVAFYYYEVKGFTSFNHYIGVADFELPK